MAIPSPRRACRTSPPTWTSPPWPTPRRRRGLQVLGYTSQARFLMNAGLMELLAQLDPSDAAAYARAVAPVQKLLSEAEMGELFNVLAVGRGITAPLRGFARGDRLGKL